VKKIALFLSLFAAVAAAAGAFAPGLLLRELNRRLASIPGHDGRAQTLRIGWREGAVSIGGFSLEKKERTAPAVFVTARSATARVDWAALRRRRLVLDVSLEKPDALFLMQRRRPEMPRRTGLWRPQGLPPFALRELRITDGKIRLRNDDVIPPTDIFFDGIELAFRNMANRPSLLASATATIAGTGRFMGRGALALDVAVRPFQPHAVYVASGSLRGFDLKAVNPLLRHYTGMDLEGGTLDVSGRFAAADGVYAGTVHRAIADVNVKRKREKMPFPTAVKEWLFETWIRMKAGKDGRVVNDYELTGPLGFMDGDLLLAIVWPLKTAFEQSLRPTLPPRVEADSPEVVEERWMKQQAEERAKQEERAR